MRMATEVACASASRRFATTVLPETTLAEPLAESNA